MTNRALRWVAVALLALSGLGAFSPAPATALQGDDCAGIETYIAGLEAAGDALEAAMPANDANLDSWTEDEFTAASDALETAQASFDAIDPPAIAEEFHALLVEQVGVLSMMFDTMAEAGVFGVLIYAERLDELETELTQTAQAVEDACGVEFTDTIENESVIADTAEASPVSVADTGASGSDAAAGDTGIGTRANPIPLGQTARIHPDWEMTVVSVTPDATDLILQDSFNEPPAPGQQFFLATVRLTYVGATSDEFYVSDLSAVGQSAVGYNQFDDYCGSIPNELPSRELFTGGTIEGNVCWVIDSADADSLVLYDSYGADEERVFLSLMPNGPASGTPVASGGFISAVKDVVPDPATPEAGEE